MRVDSRATALVLEALLNNVVKSVTHIIYREGKEYIRGNYPGLFSYSVSNALSVANLPSDFVTHFDEVSTKYVEIDKEKQYLLLQGMLDAALVSKLSEVRTNQKSSGDFMVRVSAEVDNDTGVTTLMLRRNGRTFQIHKVLGRFFVQRVSAEKLLTILDSLMLFTDNSSDFINGIGYNFDGLWSLSYMLMLAENEDVFVSNPSFGLPKMLVTAHPEKSNCMLAVWESVDKDYRIELPVSASDRSYYTHLICYSMLSNYVADYGNNPTYAMSVFENLSAIWNRGTGITDTYQGYTCKVYRTDDTEMCIVLLNGFRCVLFIVSTDNKRSWLISSKSTNSCLCADNDVAHDMLERAVNLLLNSSGKVVPVTITTDELKEKVIKAATCLKGIPEGAVVDAQLALDILLYGSTPAERLKLSEHIDSYTRNSK